MIATGKDLFMDYIMKIAGLERHLPLCKVNDELYIAAFIMFGDVELTVACAKELLKKAPDFDVILTAESKGIPLAYEMARQAGNAPYIVARKGAKLYMQDIVTVKVNSITTDHQQTLCLGSTERSIIAGKKILIADDVISTGDSLTALEQLVETAGGKTVGKAAALVEGEAIERGDVIFLEELPVFNSDGTIKKTQPQ